MLSCISIPFETVNITKGKERYTRILNDINDEIAEDDSILSWSENYVEGEGYDMVEIQEDNYSFHCHCSTGFKGRFCEIGYIKID